MEDECAPGHLSSFRSGRTLAPGVGGHSLTPAEPLGAAMVYRAVIPGTPIGKGRPRFGRGRTFTPMKTAAWEKAAAWAIRQAIPVSGLDCPMGLTIDAYFPRPKAHSKRRRQRLEVQAVTPDADNIAKAVCDALEKSGAITNDSRICYLSVRKWYPPEGEEPRVVVELSSLTGE